MSMRKTGPHRGFTLIELVITVAIVGLLASVALPLAELSVQRDKEHELHIALRDIRTGLDAYRQAVMDGRVTRVLGGSGYPPSLSILVDGVPDVSSPNKSRMIYFMRHIPRDPMSVDPTKTDEETWGKRSYASSADSPEEGDDVFDVYSPSDDVGLNGIPYRNW
jgi:general secretion pathway protein G